LKTFRFGASDIAKGVSMALQLVAALVRAYRAIRMLTEHGLEKSLDRLGSAARDDVLQRALEFPILLRLQFHPIASTQKN